MPPGDPDTRRGVTLTVPIRAHVPHALFIPGAQSLREFPVRRVQLPGLSSRSRLMAERLRHKSEKIWFPG